MCQHCIKSIAPDRGTTCYDTGAYITNFKGCHECKTTDIVLAQTNKQVSNKDIANGHPHEAEEDEVVEFDHACRHCGHIVAQGHKYTFTVTGETPKEQKQESTMECDLCGTGQDSVFVIPRPPNE